MDAVGSFALVARELAVLGASLVTSLEQDARSAFLLSLGLRPPADLLDLPDIDAAISAVSSAADSASARANDLTSAIGSADANAQAQSAATLLLAIAQFAASLEQLQTVLDGAADTLSGLTSQERSDLHAFADSLISLILGDRLAEYLRNRSITSSAVLLAAGVIAVVDEAGNAPVGLRLARSSRALRLDRLGSFMRDPWSHLRTLYGWGDTSFDGIALLRVVKAILDDLQRPSELLQPPGLPASLEAGMFQLEVDDTVSPPGFILGVRFPAQVTVADTFTESGWTSSVSAELDVEADLEVEIKPPLQLRIGTGDSAQFSISVQSARPATEAPVLLLGAANSGSRLEASGLELGVALACGVVGAASSTTASIQANGAVRGGKLVIGGDGDSLWNRAFGGHSFEAKFDTAIQWSSDTGLKIEGHAGLEVDVAAHLDLGPAFIDSVRLALGLEAGALGLAVSLAAGARLGPITLLFDGVGVQGRLAIPESLGNLGFAQFDVGWQAPRAVGLGVDASVIHGGGQLSIDSAHGTYGGTIALDGLGVALSATALATTRPAFSLAAVISAQFRAIPLGLGFTLNGVGGLIAIDRRVDVDALRAALRGPGIENIFFPSDPIAQASRLLGDLSTYFPTAPGRYVFGPAAKLAWGTPTIVEAELAVLLEMPSPVRIILLGSLHTKLPRKDHPLIQLQVDVGGELNITEQRLAIDATLRDSFVVGFPIVGDLALRAAWGGQKQFVVSVGGFHSQFRPPPGFPTLRRVLIPIGANDDPRLDITGFLALTSNTVQVGAQIELYASAGPLNISGSVGFEALFQRSPLSFEAHLWAGVSLRRGKTVLAGVHLDGKLSGPTPWHVAGEACLSLWFVDLCVDFSATFGSTTPIELPSLSILGLLVPLLEDAASWAGELGEGVARRVTTSPPVDATGAQATATRLEPAAALTVRQSVVPFNRTITRFAQSKPSDLTQVVVTTATVGSSNVVPVPVSDWFAPAEFEEMSDADRLSRDGFEQMDAGVSLSGNATAAGLELIVPLEYETVIVAPGTQPGGPRFRPTLVAQLLSGQTGTREVTPKLVARGGLPEETFVIASVEDLGARLDLAPVGPRGKAELALAAHIAANPGDAQAFVVVPTYEAA